MGVELDDGEVDRTRFVNASVKFHMLLSIARKAVHKDHPEKEGNSNVFSKLANNSIILDAEPQIGKVTFVSTIPYIS